MYNLIRSVWGRKYNNRLVQKLDELGYLPAMDTDSINDWMESFTGFFLMKYPERNYIIGIMKGILGHLPRWEDFNSVFLASFVSELLENNSQTSVRTYCAYVKSVFNYYPEKLNMTPKEYKRALQIRNLPSASIYLSLEEIEKIYRYIPQSFNEQVIVAQFLCACYTGARHSDILKMTENNIDPKTGMLSYVTQKTKTSVQLKAHAKLPGLIQIARRRVFSDSTFNNTMRKICRELGMTEKVSLYRAGEQRMQEKWEFVTGHVARRSFATNAYLSGIDIYYFQNDGPCGD